MRSSARPRRHVPQLWFFLMRPILRYSATRDAFVLRLVGSSTGPVLRPGRWR
jgi:hypothetical protein